jgi:MoxR-like ATPase
MGDCIRYSFFVVNSSSMPTHTSAAELRDRLASVGYLATEDVAVAAHLAVELDQPLLVEGEPGVGKTELAKALAEVLGARLVRLQCHDGIDLHQAAYDWDHRRQLLALRTQDAPDEQELFSRRYLLRRPLLEALESDGPTVLLIDEVDRSDEAFEAFLLEVLGEAQLTIPEIGTIVARTPPLAILTSNRTRELHDALRRRCIYAWVDLPDAATEAAIVRARLPEVSPVVADRVVRAVGRLRDQLLDKPPGIGETLAWARAVALTGDLASTVGSAVKVREDLERVRADGTLDGI